MTRDEILKMKPGRELDVLIAKTVFRNAKNSWDWEFTLPSYSTDMSAAFDVVKEMSSKNYWFGCQVLSSKCQAWFSPSPNEKHDAIENTYDLPLAICRAALFSILEAA